MPFVERIIELIDPQILVALGGPGGKRAARPGGKCQAIARALVHLSDAAAVPADPDDGDLPPRISAALAGAEATGMARPFGDQSETKRALMLPK